MEQLVIDYLKQLLDGADFQYVPKTTAPAQNEELEQLKQELARLSTRELRIKLAYENEIDTLEEYKENKIRLQKQRESLLENIKELEAQSQKIHPGIMSFRRFEVCMMFSWILLPKVVQKGTLFEL